MNNNEAQIKILDNPYLNFCYSISDNPEYMEDYRFIYKVWVLYDLYSIASIEIKDTIKQSLDKEIQNVTPLSIKRLLETAFIFANLDTEKLTAYLSEDEKEMHIEKIDDLKNQAYRIAISICYYGRYLKEIWEQEHIFFNNTVIIYRLFTRLWILTKARDEKIDDDIDIFSLDFHWKIEATRKEMKNRFSIGDLLWIGRFQEKFWEKFQWFPDDEVFFSDFQTEVMQALIEPIYEDISWNKRLKSTAISAPTSAGKTFIIKKYLIYKILEAYISWKNINIAFIVPSKALLNELKNDFTELFKNYNISEGICHIHTHLLGEDFIENYKSESNLFIFTQERLNYFYNDVKYRDWWRNFKLDITVVDEAHKVGYGYRWTLLSYIISKIKKDNEHVQLILLAPLLSKLHKFKKEFWLKSLEEKFSNFWMVAKNEIFVKITNDAPWRCKYTVFTLRHQNESISLFRVDENIWTSQLNYLATLARYFSQNQQGIVFWYDPDSVRSQAEKLINQDYNNNEKNIAVETYVRDILPDDFPLLEYLKWWVAYHNWRLPTFIKSKIEELFKNGELKYLCANSTMLEWVNLPAKNIFVWSDGKRESLSIFDFKNLIGRSWRLNEHLNGNVFYVDFEDYIDKIPNNDNQTGEYINNVTSILIDDSKFDRFLDYIKPGSTQYKEVFGVSEKGKMDERKEFEYLTWYLVANVIDNTDFLPERVISTSFELLDKDYFIKRLETYKRGDSLDFFDRIGDFIYEQRERKEEKISMLREYTYRLCNNELKIKNHLDFDQDFLDIVKRNIFVDPRKQLDFYDLVISWKQEFINNNIFYFSDINRLMRSDSTENKKKMLRLLVIEIDKHFVFTQYKEHIEWIASLINQWISEISLKKILISKKREYLKKLKMISDEVQFTYVNAASIFFEIANLAYSKYINDVSAYIEDTDIPQLDISFIFYLEVWAYNPNIIYLISKWVSRESAIWLKDNDAIIQPFPWEKYNQNSQSYFNGEKERILRELGRRNKITMKEELEKYIYN